MLSAVTTPKSIGGKLTTVRVNGDDTYHFSRWKVSVSQNTTTPQDVQGYDPNTIPTGYEATATIEYNGQQETDIREAFYGGASPISRSKGEVTVICVSPIIKWSLQRVTPADDTLEAPADDTPNNTLSIMSDRARRLDGAGLLPVEPQFT
jgi:hypothetical protein